MQLGGRVFLAKRILVVAHDAPLRQTRVFLLEQAGYTVESVGTDDDAMAMLETERFDLILLGRKSLLPKKGIDQRLREKYPDLLTLKIEGADADQSIYPSRITDNAPANVLTALSEMLGDGLRLVPLDDPHS
jgi:CheY-like chemotaxis protein